MLRSRPFPYQPTESECERAGNAYLMSLIAIMAGLPLPVLNLLATFIYYLANRKSSYFVRWHSTQALLSQFALLPLNALAFWWSASILFGPKIISNDYVAYIITVLLINLIEFIATIASAIKVRKGNNPEWWLLGNLTNMICRP